MSKYKPRGTAISLAKRMPLSEFIDKAKIIHNNKYDYSYVDYINAHTHIKIICPEHGEWMQTPMSHTTRKCGCPTCGNIKKGISKKISSYNKFILFAKNFHNNKYTYLDETFTGITSIMKIICPVHGEFSQSPDVHKRAGCQRCGSGPVSEASQVWLDSLHICKEYREIWIKLGSKRIKVDAYDPNTNTIYEYWGDYWHGNPDTYDHKKVNSNNKKTFGELYSLTMERISLIESAGYALVQVWEKDWLKSISNTP
jgi:hypothetical protein